MKTETPNYVIAAIGLAQVGLTDLDEIAKHVFGEPNTPELQAKRTARFSCVYESDEPWIREALIEGLPLGTVGRLLHPYRCSLCGYLSKTAPCLCGLHGLEPVPCEPDSLEDLIAVPPRPVPCSYQAGSTDKIDEMQHRFSCGLQIFHSDDPAFQQAEPPVDIQFAEEDSPKYQLEQDDQWSTQT